MIIKTRICAGGGRSLTRFPVPRFTMEECLTGGKLDLSKAMLAFTGDTRCFQISNRDCERTLWASLTFCELMQDAFGRCVDSAACDLDDHAVTKQDAKIAERIERRCVWVRQSVFPSADGVTVKVRVDNPFNCAGQTLEEGEAFAATACQLWLRIIEQTTVMRIRLETDALHLDRAKANNARAELRAKYANCRNRRGRYCTPMDPLCPCYDSGNCRYKEIAK